ncbi:MAG: PEP-CTERM sorting domain-containing protein [Verrucomicrobiota bacterium]
MTGTRFRKLTFSIVFALGFAFISGTSQAVTLIFTFSGIASGSLGGVGFTDRAYTFSATVDTADRMTVASGFSYNSVTPQASIAGFGVVTFSGNFRVNINNNTGGLGIPNDDENFDTVSAFNPVFDTYDGLTPIGPVLTNAFITAGAYPISTTGGALSFNGAADVPVTVRVIPEPTGVVLLILGIAGLALRRRR